MRREEMRGEEGEEEEEEEEEDNLFRYAAMHLMIDGVTSRKDIADFF